jgi:endo-1,4-beta-mannosidase
MYTQRSNPKWGVNVLAFWKQKIQSLKQHYFDSVNNMRIGIFTMLIFLLAQTAFAQMPAGFAFPNGSQFRVMNADGTSSPFYFSGTNNYYLMYKSMPMVEDVLNDMLYLNHKVVRMWFFMDGAQIHDGHNLQSAAGVYNETTMRHIDAVMAACAQRGIKVVPAFVNYWSDFGGMPQYAQWAGTSAESFYSNATCKQLYKNYVANWINRVNTVTGVRYKDDPTIFSWQLTNEARSTPANLSAYVSWVREMSDYVRSLDTKHMISIGDEGFFAYTYDQVQQINAQRSAQGKYLISNDWPYSGSNGDWISTLQMPNISYGTIHNYATDNWGYTLAWGESWTKYHIEIANQYNKPCIMEEYDKAYSGAWTVAADQTRATVLGAYQTIIRDQNMAGDMAWMLVGRNYSDPVEAGYTMDNTAPVEQIWLYRVKWSDGHQYSRYDPHTGPLMRNHAIAMAAKNGSSTSNLSPIALAGADQAVSDSDNNGSQSVSLNAGGSFDPDGTIASYIWREGTTQIATGVTPTVNLTVGTHNIILTVTDNRGATGTDNIAIAVLSGGSAVFEAEAGALSGSSTLLSGASSSGNQYVQISASPASIVFAVNNVPVSTSYAVTIATRSHNGNVANGDKTQTVSSSAGSSTSVSFPASATWRTNIVNLNLSAGSNTITIAANWGYVEVDYISIQGLGGGTTNTLTVSPASLTYTSAAASQNIAVTSNVSWTASSNQTWLTLSPASGSNNGTIAASASANTGTARTATVTITGGGMSRTVSVTQASPSTANLTVSPTTLTYASAAASQNITVTSNVSWTASSDQTWLTVSPTSGSNNGAVAASASANTSTTGRTATITITGGGISRTVAVTQSAPATANLTVSPTSLSYNSAAASQNISVTSNVSWTASSNQTWLTVSPTSGSNNGTVAASATANAGTTSRTATVTITGGGISRTVSVTQSAPSTTTQFASRQGTNFMLDGKVFFFAGTNTYDIMNFGSGSGDTETQYMDKAKIDAHFTNLQNDQVKVLRLWIFNHEDWHGFEKQEGVFNEQEFAQFDYIIQSAKAHNVMLIPVFENYWEAYGGIDRRLSWEGLGSGQSNRWRFFKKSECPGCFDQYKNYVSFILNRVNHYSGIAYKNDPTIFAWDLMNEPRYENATPNENTSGVTLRAWVDEMGQYVKSIDPNHMVMVGIEGHESRYGFGGDEGVPFVYVQQSPYIDMTSAHPYPTEAWANLSIAQTKTLIRQWISDSHNLVGKPFYMSEWNVHNVDRTLWWNEIFADFEAAGGNGTGFWWYQATSIDGKFGVSPGAPELAAFRSHSQRMQAKSGGTTNTLTVSPTSLTYTSAAGSQNINVTSNVSWTASSNQTWLTLSPASGSNNGTVAASASANTSTASRTATVTITGGGISRTIAITQSAPSTANLTVSPTSLTYTSSAGSQNITVTSNVSWTASSNQSWLTLSTASGSNDGTIAASATANSGTVSRTATVTIIGGGISRTVSVTQSAPSTSNLTVSPTSLTFASVAGSQSASVTSNVSWTVASNQTWLTVSPASGSNNGTVTISVAANSGTARSGVVTITGGGITRTINVSQSAPSTPSSNLALNKPVTVSSTEAGSNVAANAVDGNTSTRWASVSGSDGQWIYVDLGATQTISRVKISWEAAYATAYQIQTSNDASTWTTIKSVTGNSTLVNDNTNLSGSGRYVRINGTSRVNSAWGYSIFELEIYSTSPTNNNLALNKPATASSQESSSVAPGNAVDGSTGTRWASVLNPSTAQWLTVDLGSTQTIGRVKITWEAAYATAYQIQTSNDASTWTTLKSVTGNSTLVNDNTGLAGSGRYVRINCTARVNSSWGYSIYELEVYTSSTGARVADEVVSSETRGDIKIAAYPNPVSDQITLRFTGNVIGGQVRMFNQMGQEVVTEKINDYEHVMDVSRVPSGIYMIGVFNKNTKAIIKIRKD